MAATAIIKLRRATAAAWTAAGTTVLAVGEIAYEIDTRAIKVGDGTTVWTSLPYVLYGVGKTWTPTVTQTTTPTFTTSNHTYSRVGRRILGNGLIAVTAGTGTAGAAISLGIPVACAASGLNLGTATWFDTGNGYWSGNLISTSTTLAGIYGSYAIAGGYGLTGTTNANGLVTNDTIAMQFNYEAATD